VRTILKTQTGGRLSRPPVLSNAYLYLVDDRWSKFIAIYRIYTLQTDAIGVVKEEFDIEKGGK
jgi:hypothetical protein